MPALERALFNRVGESFMALNSIKHKALLARHGALTTLACATLVLLAACGGGKGEQASQTAAKVNREEITVHQINFMLQRQPGLKPEQTEAASRQVLERLIDEELALQKAEDMKLDRDPRVVQQIEAAKREIIARAYVERLAEGAAKPTPEEISKYYEDKPALFKERRIYSLQELAIDARPEQLPELRAKLAAVKSPAEFVEYLKGNDYRFQGSQAVRAAEQLPLVSLDVIARMKDGDSAFSPAPGGVKVLYLLGSRSQPVDEARARPAIEQFLLNQRKGERVQSELKALRAAAKIEYVGSFAQGASGAAAAAASGASATSPAPAASGLDANAISKGMGLK